MRTRIKAKPIATSNGKCSARDYEEEKMQIKIFKEKVKEEAWVMFSSFNRPCRIKVIDTLGLWR